MAQQINLCNPILLAPRRHFSSRRLAQALSVLLAGIGLLAGWALWSTVQLRSTLASSSAVYDAEKRRLQAGLAGLAQVSGGTAALEQELAAARAALAERQRLLDALTQGLGEGPGPAARLTLLSRTLPATVWLTEVRLRDGRLALAGQTYQPDLLPRWLSELGADAQLQGARLALVRVERGTAGTAGTASTAGTAGSVGAWSFEAATAAPAASAPASGGAR